MQEGKPQLDWFQNDEAIAEFLGARDGLTYDDYKSIFAIDLDRTSYFGEASSSSNPDDENEAKHMIHNRLGTLPIDKEQSTLLVEETEEINIEGAETVHKIHLAKSLDPMEKEKFIQFLHKGQSTLHWSYSDMPGLDPELILHHLPLLPRVKPYK